MNVVFLWLTWIAVCMAQIGADYIYQSESNSDERIVGGTKAEPNAYPFMVHLLTTGSADEICGGSLINPYFILTAGHCIKKKNGVEPKRIQVKLGINKRIGKQQPHMQVGEVEKWYYKPFNHTNLHSDIALLKMRDPINFTEAVKPACLPPPGFQYSEGLARALGWGATHEGLVVLPVDLQEVDLPILPDNECKNIYPTYFDPHTAFCAGYKEGVKDTCRGDSGGPLFIKDDNKNFVVIGITSFTKGGCARPDHFAVYTKISSFMDWIVGKASQGGHICIANFGKSK